MRNNVNFTFLRLVVISASLFCSCKQTSTFVEDDVVIPSVIETTRPISTTAAEEKTKVINETAKQAIKEMQDVIDGIQQAIKTGDESLTPVLENSKNAVHLIASMEKESGLLLGEIDRLKINMKAITSERDSTIGLLITSQKASDAIKKTANEKIFEAENERVKAETSRSIWMKTAFVFMAVILLFAAWKFFVKPRFFT